MILTKNEADRIRDCLASVAWAAERLVIDDESTDATVRIAESLGARVLRRKMDIEGRHRNWASTQARHEWILSLDADERVTPELAEEIGRLVRNGAPYEIYAVPRRNYLGGRWIRHGGWYPSAQLKLFKKSVFRWEEASVHPRAISDRPCGTLQSDLLHYSYRDLSDFVEKLNRQTSLEAQKWLADGRRMPMSKALWRSVDRYLRAYRSKQGYRDGLVGYVLAVMGGMYQFLSYAKYWEQGLPQPAPWQGAMSRLNARPAGPRPRVGVLLLAKNEARRIGRCLASIDWVDEVVVVDDESTDDTAAVCQAFGATIIRRRLDTFAAQGNAGLAAMTADWVLSMDADEAVTPPLRAAIEAALAAPGPHVAFRFKRLNFFLGHRMRWGGWYHDVTHLFRRAGTTFEGALHHHPAVTGPVGSLQGDMEHRPFERLDTFLTRQNRYTSMEVDELMAAGGVASQHARRQLTARPTKLFWKFFIKKQGFREGRHGFVFSVLFAWVEFIKWAKVLERCQGGRWDA